MAILCYLLASFVFAEGGRYPCYAKDFVLLLKNTAFGEDVAYWGQGLGG